MPHGKEECGGHCMFAFAKTRKIPDHFERAPAAP
jgi:hypothetical protein